MIKRPFKPKKIQILSLIEQVTSLYEEVDQKIRAFKKLSGIRCYPGCGRCCNSKNIEVTVLEMLPLVFHLYQNKQIESWREKLSDVTSWENKKCSLYSQRTTGSQLGHCTYYEWRPLICRLFGFSFIVNKFGDKMLYSCPIIKSKLGDQFHIITKEIQFQWQIPATINYYFKIALIDSGLTGENYSLNMAIKLAIDVFLNSGLNLYLRSG